jgi:heme exporter protein A
VRESASSIDVAATGLSRRYGRRWALIDVSLEVARGEVLMIAGRNGSGKSTLLRILSTAIRPNAGSARVGGFDVVREREDVRLASALVGHASYLYEALTARENLAIVALTNVDANIDGALARVGLADRAGDAVSTFSAGMRKRLSLARMLLQKPRIAFIDEPYSQLDPAGFALIDEVVRELQGGGATVVLATHQLARGAELASRSIVLQDGRVVWRGAAKETPVWS